MPDPTGAVKSLAEEFPEEEGKNKNSMCVGLQHCDLENKKGIINVQCYCRKEKKNILIMCNKEHVDHKTQPCGIHGFIVIVLNLWFPVLPGTKKSFFTAACLLEGLGPKG